MKKQRGIAISLIITLLLTLIPSASVFADNHLVGAEKAGVELVYMEYKPGVTEDNYEDELAAVAPIVEEKAVPSDLDVGSEFLLGVRLKNLKAAKHASAGMYNMTTALFYDERYIELLPMNNTEALARMQLYLGFRNTEPLMGRKSPLKMGYGASFGKASKTGNLREYLITLKSTQHEPLYKGITDELMAVIPVKITAKPPAGTILFTFPDHGHNTIAFGKIGATWTYSGEQMGVDPDQDVSQILTYDASGVNLFPAAATPTAAKIKAGTDVDLSDLKVGAKISGLDALKLVISYDSGPNKEKAPTKFYYGPDGKEDAAGNADVAGLTEFGVAENVVAAMNGQYLYAYYEEAGKKFLVKSGAAIDGGKMKVKDPIESITFDDIGAMTYGDSLYDKLPATITATTTGGVVTNPVKAAVKWEYKLKTADDTAYAEFDEHTVVTKKLDAGAYTVRATYPDMAPNATATKDVTIAKKGGLTITANDKTIEFGAPIPAFDATVVGAVAGDVATILAALKGPSFTNADIAPMNSVAREVDIDMVPKNQNDAIWKNYEVPAFVKGKLTVHPKSIILAEPDIKLGSFIIGAVVNAGTEFTVGIADTKKVPGFTDVKIKVTINAALDTAAAGTDKTVGITKVGTGLTGADAGCYVVVDMPANGRYDVTAKTLTGIEKVADPIKPLNSYKDGDTLDLSGLSIKFLYGSDPEEIVTLAKIGDAALDSDLFIADSGKTDAADVTTPITNGAALDKAMDGKALYIKRGDKLLEIGKLKIRGKKTTPDPAGAAPDKAGIKVTPPAGTGPFEYAVVSAGAVPTDADYKPLPADGIYGETTNGTPFTANTPYDVYVRAKADADDDASDPAVADVTTWKNILTVKNASNTVLARGFVDDMAAGTVANKDALSALVVNPPAGVIEYYTAASMKDDEAVNYTTFAITGDTTVYAKLPAGGGGTSPGVGGGGGGGSTVEEKSLKLIPDKIVGEPKDTQKLTVEMKGISGDVKFSSADEKIATVDANGNVTLVAIGTTTITAEVAGLKATASVEVLDPEASLIDFDFLKPFIYGYPDGSFRPDRSITRAEVAAIVSRILRVRKDDTKRYPTSFGDVPSDEWYADYVGYLTGKGIIKGRSETVFDPDAKITRAEFVALLARAARFKASESANKFSDVADSHWAKSYITTMSEKQIIGGYPDGTFGPERNLTRAEAAKIVIKLLKDADAVGKTIANDISTDHWAYGDVFKAMNERRAK